MLARRMELTSWRLRWRQGEQHSRPQSPYAIAHLVESTAGDRNHRFVAYSRAAYSVGTSGALRRCSDCGITHPADLDLRSWDIHGFCSSSNDRDGLQPCV